jgi:hypothetical protein
MDTPLPDYGGEPLEFQGRYYADPVTLDTALAVARRKELYPWIEKLDHYWQVVGLIAIACGGCGGFLREAFFSITRPNSQSSNWTLLGILMGPAVLLSVSGVREILIESGSYRIWSIAALTFLSGCFSEESFSFLQKIYKQISKKVLQ